ncbi:MAG: hypothetical protein P4L81_03555 [Candidatus Pacebacteria bacterium]|nr:hypothetical protein [Candidatus Paceibacterota bacterium]
MNDTKAVDTGFASFWHGALNPYAFGCLSSFARAGASLIVYSYDPRIELPDGVQLADARTIYPDPAAVGRYRVGGKPSLATFADMFRYRMIRETGRCWVDADVVCLRQPDFFGDEYIFGRQADAVSEELVNNAVLRLPQRSSALSELVETADSAINADLKWGAIGPFLLTPLLRRHGDYSRARPPHQFYPIEPELFGMLFLPARRDEVEAKILGSTFLHLWSEAIKLAGWDLTVGPPAGSYLHDAFFATGTLSRFERLAESDEAEAAFILSE